MSDTASLLRAIVIDDDAFSRAQVALELERHAGTVVLLAHCEGGEEGLHAIHELRPDLVFLDVQMPGMDGFAMLDALGERDFGVIFITSFDKYAIRAIRYSALDYLLKPIKSDELDAAIAHVLAQRDQLPARLEHLLAQKHPTDPPNTLVIATRKGDRHLRTRDIIRCEADRNYTWFHLRRGERLLSSYTLSTYEEFLAENEFLRVHRSHIVNVEHVRTCSAEGLLTLNDGTEIEVSRRRKTEVLNALHAR
ncbi:MAG: LytTR family DNA-binding domain-containing protein [Flavobacteriales bacterium]